ncbi:hypothetical protein D3C78_1074290 [compost metagenome]
MSLYTGQSKVIANLPTKNRDSNSGSKADGYGFGNKFYECAEFEQSHQNQHDSGKKSGDQKILIPILHYNSK